MDFPEDEDHGGNTYDPKASKPLNSKDIELQLGTVATIDGSADSSNKLTKKQQDERKLKKMGIMTALAIGIHNFPEGLATFVGALDDPKVGGALAVAIGIHNIPEGLCVAIPIYYATGDRWKAFGWVSERVIDIDAIPSYAMPSWVSH
jgi:zinc transporter ZupT